MTPKTEQEMKDEFWKSLSSSPIVMLEIDGAPHTAAPMTAQLDKDARHAIWFFTSRDSTLGRMGRATATFSGTHHELFARFAGQLTEEKSRAVLEKLWSNPVSAWFPEGKNSPQVLLMRMDLGEASIWSGKMGALTLTKMLLGMSIANEVKGQHAHTSL